MKILEPVGGGALIILSVADANAILTKHNVHDIRDLHCRLCDLLVGMGEVRFVGLRPS